MLVHAIMCGGSGTRLWPLSRRSHPKQFLPLLDQRSLLQATIDRQVALPGPCETLVIGNDEHRFLIAEHLEQAAARVAEIVLEPACRNTAGTAVVAALRAKERYGEDALVLLSPADHRVKDPDSFARAVQIAARAAAGGYVVAFGIRPDHAETGYGYIELGDELEECPGALRVARFHEKPSRQVAEAYLAGGRHAWNAGIFLFAAGHLVAAARCLQPDMLAACGNACRGGQTEGPFYRLDADAYARVERISFDHAFAEQVDRLAVVPVEMGWSDLGSWQALYRARGGNGGGENVVDGPAELFDSTGIIAMSDGPLIVAHDVKDLVVVANRDAVYVAAAGAEAAGVVAELERRNRPEALTHRRCHRPWGWYQTLDRGERFHVKEIVVKPGARLSLQAHCHRAEHWVVLAGSAKVQVGDETRMVGENQSVFVPANCRHRLENPGSTPVHLIEVQTGCYLGEDDIVRFDDAYGRS